MYTHVSAIRYQVEELQRKLKQLTGIESGLCRQARIKKSPCLRLTRVGIPQKFSLEKWSNNRSH